MAILTPQKSNSIFMKKQISSSLALGYLQKDVILEKLIVQYGPLEFLVHESDIFCGIVESIISQQLSGKVSKVIYSRLKNLFIDKTMEPHSLLAIADEKLRAVGMSWAKVRYVKDLAEKTLDKTIQLENLKTMSDEEIVAHLEQVKGIGRWTAEMILMFSLERPDVFPTDDAGIQIAFERLYKVKRGNKNNMLSIANAWRPYRTLACRYLWKSLDNE